MNSRKTTALLAFALTAVLVLPAAFAQGCGAPEEKQAEEAVYTCPMHPEVTSDKPGECPKCGAEEAVYTCPMHPEVTSDKPGECPKCGMDLVEKQPAETR